MKKIYLLTTGLCLSLSLIAQSPGGVSAGLSLWLKADAASTLNLTGSNVNSWTYFNNGSNSFSYTAGTQATFLSNAINNLPAIGFSNTEMDGPTGVNAPLAAGSVAYSVFAVWNSAQSNTTPQRVWTQWGGSGISGNGTSLWLYNGQWGDQPEIAPFTTGMGNNYSVGTFNITQMNLLNLASNDLELVDQNNLATSPTVLSTNAGSGNTTRANLSTAVNSLGYRTSGTPNEFFNGNLSELIVYSNSISAGASRNQIFSYLSMKYGIPIGVNLVSSAGTTIWDATANATYNNDVFGLAVDNTSGLNVQSSSASTTAGVSGKGNIILTPNDLLNVDQSFLMIGHDNGALTETTSNLPASAAGSQRLARTWLAQNTGGSPGLVGRVNVGFDLTGLPITGTIGTASDFRLITNNSGDATFASGTDGIYTPTSFTGNVANFTGVKLPNGAVFAIITNASGSTPLPVNFITFTAQPSGSNVDLNWTVGDNDQANTYQIERSSDDKSFAKIGEVANSAARKSYSFADENAGAGTHYYRVLETDLDGKSIYSKVVSATISAGDFAVNVLNNPSKGGTNAQLQINAVSAGTAFVELWSVGGHRMSLQQEAIGAGTTTIPVPTSGIPAGSYVLKVIVGNNTHVTQVVKL